VRTSGTTSNGDARSVASKSGDVLLNELEQGLLISKTQVKKSFALKDGRGEETPRVYLYNVRLDCTEKNDHTYSVVEVDNDQRLL
jgi:hypothetical protein